MFNSCGFSWLTKLQQAHFPWGISFGTTFFLPEWLKEENICCTALEISWAILTAWNGIWISMAFAPELWTSSLLSKRRTAGKDTTAKTLRAKKASCGQLSSNVSSQLPSAIIYLQFPRHFKTRHSARPYAFEPGGRSARMPHSPRTMSDRG